MLYYKGAFSINDFWNQDWYIINGLKNELIMEKLYNKWVKEHPEESKNPNIEPEILVLYSDIKNNKER